MVTDKSQDMNFSYTLYKNKIMVTHFKNEKYWLILHLSVNQNFSSYCVCYYHFNIYLLCGKIPCDGVHRHQKARVCPCGYHVFTDIKRQWHHSGTCVTNTGTGIYRSLCRGTDPSAQYMAKGHVVFVLFLQQRPGARGKITILTSTPEATMLFNEKDPSLVYLFIFSFIIMHPSVR